MLSYCLKCGENTKSISPLVSKTKNGETITLSKRQSVLYTKNQDLLKNKKQKDY